jgi:hypothetical protein
VHQDLLGGEVTETELDSFEQRKLTFLRIFNNFLNRNREFVINDIVEIGKDLRNRFKDARFKYERLCKIRSWLSDHKLFDEKSIRRIDEDQKKIKLCTLEDVVKNSEITLTEQSQKDIVYFISQKSILFEEIVKHFIEEQHVRKECIYLYS